LLRVIRWGKAGVDANILSAAENSKYC